LIGVSGAKGTKRSTRQTKNDDGYDRMTLKRAKYDPVGSEGWGQGIKNHLLPAETKKRGGAEKYILGKNSVLKTVYLREKKTKEKRRR